MRDENEYAYIPRMVIEGRIEQGQNATVALSLNKAYVDSFDVKEFQQMIVRWGKVTIIDSHGNREVLTGRVDVDYPTRFIYAGTDIEGRVGESYVLEVEYSGRTWIATTTIPPATRLINLNREWVCDSLYRLRAELPADPARNACLVECAIGGSRYYRPALMGILGREDSDTLRTITINRPLDYLNITQYTTFFHRDEQVRLRVCTMDDFGYSYWSCWENINVNSLNPVFPAERNPPTNFSGHDVMGIWCGYGASYHLVPADK